MNKEQLEESCKVVNVETCGPEQLIKNKKVQKLVEALEEISLITDFVESQSTGSKQFFKADGALLAKEALKDWE